jgi:Holliday junction resolvasome RuvABC endonuclease subunit
MIVLGCDPSLTDHGWSVIDYADPENPVIVATGRIRTKSKDFFTKRYRKHYEGIVDVIETFEPEYVGLEQPPPQASWSAGLYPIWISIADICTERRLPFATWMPTSVKAYARDVLGDTGKMFKSDMVDAANEILGTKAKLNHNIADAVIINKMTYRFRCLATGIITEENLTEKERYLFTRTVTKRKTGAVEKKGMIFKEGEFYFDLLDSKYDYLYE